MDGTIRIANCCSSSDCKKFKKCKMSYINQDIGTICALYDYGNYMSGSCYITKDGIKDLQTSYWCGGKGGYRMFEKIEENK